ncbi:MAG: hypothetical protein KAX30_06830 [Candidatus Atribacteria bacterium]|nr:hypothetical protein [Candidatus Atribacteria bacterium]
MNYYIVVEGKRVEPAVYNKWISYLNPKLYPISHISEFKEDNYLIFPGYGYPNYFEVINDAIQDVLNNPIIDYLIIAIDSEEMTYEQKYQEIHDFISDYINKINIIIIVQHFCIETWALGNRLIIKRNPENAQLKCYIRYFNIVTNDPELLPPFEQEDLNRSQFAEKYLRKALNDRYRNLTYSKNRPDVLVHPKYFQQVKLRYDTTNHIQSFGKFLDAFVQS